jgi:hypothetical protein
MVQIVMLLVIVALFAIIATAARPVYAFYSEYGQTRWIVDKKYGIDLISFRINGVGKVIDEHTSERAVSFELQISTKTPVYPIVQVIDRNGFTQGIVEFPEFSKDRQDTRNVRTFDDITAKSETVVIPSPVGYQIDDVVRFDDEFYTINIFLFKDPEHVHLFENIGYMVTGMVIAPTDGGSCYQSESFCFHMTGLENEIESGRNKPPFGWEYSSHGDPAFWLYRGSLDYLSHTIAYKFGREN